MRQGEAIRAARASQRLTQAALASGAGVSVNTVKRAEAGLPVQDETIRGLCAVLGLDAASYPREPQPAPATPQAVPVSDVDGATVPAVPGRASALDALRAWDPTPEIRAVIALGVVAVFASPFLLAGALAYHRGYAPRVGVPPDPFAWLDPTKLNLAFSSTMLFVLMLVMGFGIFGEIGRFLVLGEEGAPLARMDTVKVPLATTVCYLLLAPVADGWGIGQELAMMALPDGAVSWSAGLLLVVAQACLVVRLGRVCGPIIHVPPLVPFGLGVAFFALAPAHGTEGVNLAAALLVIACAAGLRRRPERPVSVSA